MPTGLVSLTTSPGLQENPQDCWIKALPVTLVLDSFPCSLDLAPLFLARQEAPYFPMPSQMP